MKIHNKQFYDGEVDKEKYVKAQIERHKAKRNKKREKSHYKFCADEISDLVSKKDKMICLGTRNNHERDCFDTYLEGVDVFSLDISPLSRADFLMDFNEFPEEWSNKWDILFSNSLDHSVNATESIEEWLRIVKKGGILIIGIESTSLHDQNKGLSAADCCSFDIDVANQFMERENDHFSFLKSFSNSYNYYVIRKK